MSQSVPTTQQPDRAGRCATIIVAGGEGRRYGGLKQYADLAGRRVLDHSIAAARAATDLVVLVVPPQLADRAEPGVDALVAGGTTRSESVRAGLAAVPDDVGIIAVHDAVRPLASIDLFTRVIAAVRDGADGVVPGVDVVDTLRRRVGPPGPVARDELVAVQTPQAFAASVLRSAHADVDAQATDDASLVDALGGTVVVVPGERSNLKITEAVDLAIAEVLVPAADEPAPTASEPQAAGNLRVVEP